MNNLHYLCERARALIHPSAARPPALHRGNPFHFPVSASPRSSVGDQTSTRETVWFYSFFFSTAGLTFAFSMFCTLSFSFAGTALACSALPAWALMMASSSCALIRSRTSE